MRGTHVREPPRLRGTAFGMFNLLTGIALLVASIIAGALWEAAGPKGTFLAGAVFALIALYGLVAIRRYVPESAMRSPGSVPRGISPASTQRATSANSA
jgi:MFS family permease